MSSTMNFAMTFFWRLYKATVDELYQVWKPVWYKKDKSYNIENGKPINKGLFILIGLTNMTLNFKKTWNVFEHVQMLLKHY